VAECSLPSLKLLEIKVPTMEWTILNDCSQTLQEVFIDVACGQKTCRTKSHSREDAMVEEIHDVG